MCCRTSNRSPFVQLCYMQADRTSNLHKKLGLFVLFQLIGSGKDTAIWAIFVNLLKNVLSKKN